MSSIDWTEFAGTDDNNDRFKFTTIGDTITGVITAAKVITSDYGRAPLLTITIDDVSRDVIVGQAQLRAKIADKRPQVGDTIRLAYTGTEDRGGGKTLKLFSVDVKKSDTPAPRGAGRRWRVCRSVLTREHRWTSGV